MKRCVVKSRNWLRINCQILFHVPFRLSLKARDQGLPSTTFSRPRRITPSEISIILHMIQKPNSITVLLFIENNSLFKNIAKTCLPHRSINVQFIFDSVRLGLSSSANILQIACADVALRVVFLLFLPCF